MPPADPSTANRLTSSAYRLSIRQQPERAKVAAGGKEKDRKAIDPPPMVQLRVQDPMDPAQNYLQSPYYLVACNLWHESEDKPIHDDEKNETPLVGSLVSSLHRLKDTDNADGGFFVFGDVSVKVEGMYRLKFTLFEILAGQVVSLQSVMSDVFQVFSTKHFPGMSESTFISRSFGDQGVRIRIRKENRKRPASRDNNSAENGSYSARDTATPTQSTSGYSQNGYAPTPVRYYEENAPKRPRPSHSHASEMYDTNNRQQWSGYSQATTSAVQYPTHSTASQYNTPAAPSLENFSYRHGSDSGYSPGNYNTHEVSRGYDGTNGHIAHANTARYPTEHLQYGSVSAYPTANGTTRDIKHEYSSADSHYQQASTSLPPLSGSTQGANGKASSGPYSYQYTPTQSKAYTNGAQYGTPDPYSTGNNIGASPYQQQ